MLVTVTRVPHWNKCNIAYEVGLCHTAGMSIPKRNEQAETDWLSPDEFGDRIPGGLGGAAVRKWARAGKIPGALQLPNGRWQIPADAVNAILNGGQAV